MNTNNRDLRTGLLFKIEDKKEQTYLFSCPDGFQRVANFQKLKFGKVKVFFVPSLDPDHFAGFPGFFLSSREAKQEADAAATQMTVLIAPAGATEHLVSAVSFMGEWWHDLQVVELPADLTSPLMAIDEESKDSETGKNEWIF